MAYELESQQTHEPATLTEQYNALVHQTVLSLVEADMPRPTEDHRFGLAPKTLAAAFAVTLTASLSPAVASTEKVVRSKGINYYPPHGKVMNHKIHKIESMNCDSTLGVSRGHEGQTKSYGKMTLKYVNVDGGEHVQYTVETTEHICEALGTTTGNIDTGAGSKAFFPTFRYVKTLKNHRKQYRFTDPQETGLDNVYQSNSVSVHMS